LSKPKKKREIKSQIHIRVKIKHTHTLFYVNSVSKPFRFVIERYMLILGAKTESEATLAEPKLSLDQQHNL